MIIKSLGRKASSRAGGAGNTGRSFTASGKGKSPFQKLTDYMVREDDGEKSQSVLWHGFYGQAGMDEAEIYKAFEGNAEKLKYRANGNVLYHEIISFAKGYRLKDEALIRAVADIGQEYLRQRAEEQMAFGAVHIDTEHIHLHLMISANTVGKSERVRLSKKEFADIQKSVEAYTLAQYPELGQTPIYDRDPSKHRERLKTEVHEQAMKSRTREPSRKESIKSRLHNLFEMAGDRQALDELLRAEKLSFYTRGKNQGIIETLEDGTTRKHRLQTLGLAEHYTKTVERFGVQTKTQPPESKEPSIQTPKQPTEPTYTDDILKRAHDREHGRDAEPQATSTQENPTTPPPADRKSDRGNDDLERWTPSVTPSLIWTPPQRQIILPWNDLLFTHLAMNARQAKAEPLVEFLARMGYQPAQVRGNDVWYTSPFRPSEKTPSFKIDRLKNLWFDHGAGQGGTIIDFVQELHPQADFSQILSTIGDTVGAVGQVHTRHSALHQSSNREQLVITELPAIVPAKAPPIIESVASIDDRLLEAYLTSRAIPIDLARVYLKQIAYTVGGKSYRALAFPNDAGGFEVRNPHFKGTIGKKDLSYIPNIGVAMSHHTAVFEGFFDFLSVLAHYGKDQASANVLVFNSLSLLERGAEKLNITATRKIYAYLDQDEAGRAGLATLRERGSWDIVDGSHLYQHHKDANEFLVWHHGLRHTEQKTLFTHDRSQDHDR